MYQMNAKLTTSVLPPDSADMQALLASEQSLRLVIDTIPGLVWSSRSDGHIDYLNQRWLDFTGLTLAQASGWGWQQAVHPDDNDALTKYWTSILIAGTAGEYEARLRRYDGVHRWFLFRGVPLYDASGAVVKWYGTNTDIEDRKQAEEKLRVSEKSLADGQRLTKTGTWVLDFKTGNTDWSLETCRIFGFPEPPPSPHYGKFRARVHPEDQEAVDRGLLDSFETGEPRPLHYRYILPDGTAKFIETISEPVKDAAGKVLRLMGTIMDITESKKVAEALRASEYLARGQVDALSRSLAALSRESMPEKFLEHVLRIAGEQLGADSVSVWEMNDHTGRVDLAADCQGEVMQMPAKDENQPSLHLSDAKIDHPVWTDFFRMGNYCVYGAIQNGPPWAQVAAHPDGPWYDWRSGMVDNPVVPQMIQDIASSGIVATLNVPMFVADKVTGLFVMCFTQTRLFRHDEIELTRAMANQAMLAIQLMRLSQAHRESAVISERNRMARDIHDTLAQGFTGVIVQLEAAEDASSRGLVNEAHLHVARAGELARYGLHEARRSVLALRLQGLEGSDLSTAMDQLLRRLTADTSLHPTLALHGTPYSLPAQWEDNLLRITQEVVINALRYARANEFKARLLFEAHRLNLELRDNGCGFDTTLKHDGFGLMGIKERVTQMGGEISIRSAEGLGTTISITLPLTDNPTLAAS